jgi:hypothetical protein
MDKSVDPQPACGSDEVPHDHLLLIPVLITPMTCIVRRAARQAAEKAATPPEYGGVRKITAPHLQTFVDPTKFENNVPPTLVILRGNDIQGKRPGIARP